MKLTKYEQIKEENIFTISIDGEEWAAPLAASYKQGAKALKIKGFSRPERAPLPRIKENMNPWVQSNIYNSAADTLLKKVIDFTENSEEYKAKKELEIFSVPDIKISKVDDANIEFQIIYFEYPKVEVKKYKNLDIDFLAIDIDEKEIDDEIEFIISRESVKKDSKDKVLKKGHIAIFDFNGFIDEKEFDGGKAERYELLIGSNQFIPGFEDKMIGLKIDEEKDLKLSFPEEYHARDFAGKDVTFKVKLHEIKEEVKPELNNEFVKSLSFVKAETVKELRDFIRDTIKQTKFGDIENKNKSMLIKSLLENNIFTKIPTPMLSDEIRKIKEQFHSTLKDQNLTFKKFLELTNQKEEAFEVNFVRSAEDIIKISLLIEEIKKLEKISVDKKVLDEKIKELIDAKYVEADDKEKIELIRNNIESIETEKLIMDLLFEINKSKTSKVNKKETTKTEKVNKKETIKTEKVQKKETTKTEKVEVVKEKTKKPTKKVETVKDTSVKKPVEEKKVSTKKNKK